MTTPQNNEPTGFAANPVIKELAGNDAENQRLLAMPLNFGIFAWTMDMFGDVANIFGGLFDGSKIQAIAANAASSVSAPFGTTPTPGVQYVNGTTAEVMSMNPASTPTNTLQVNAPTVTAFAPGGMR